jgi:CubicO group peptidase (beta-lactamase class C family)
MTPHSTSTIAAPTIDAAIDRALAEQRIVGAVILIARDGDVVVRRAVGQADRERNVAMREQAVFRLASLTKPLVTAAALRMVELGAFSLADPVTRFLPEFPASDGPTRSRWTCSAPRCRSPRAMISMQWCANTCAGPLG